MDEDQAEDNIEITVAKLGELQRDVSYVIDEAVSDVKNDVKGVIQPRKKKVSKKIWEFVQFQIRKEILENKPNDLEKGNANKLNFKKTEEKEEINSDLSATDGYRNEEDTEKERRREIQLSWNTEKSVLTQIYHDE